MTDISENGHEHIRIAVRPVGLVEKMFVYLIEVGFRLLFMAEYLDDLLPVHILLDKALRFCHGALLPDKVLRRAAADRFGNEKHQKDAAEYDQRKPNAVIEHDPDQRKDHDRRSQQLRQTFGNYLTERIDVVRIIAHDVAVIVRIEVADGKILHSVEHLSAHLFQIALRKNRKKLFIDRARNERKHIQTYQNTHGNRHGLPCDGPGLIPSDCIGDRVIYRLHKERRK